ncbi:MULTISPECIES: ABC transporter permease subunit [Devosia]|uniref:Oligopeptide transport system permease protein OppB n=1 Tax=Devosia equisanguinis TaxID=2490941 RepID=A0A3S4CRR7_9HYPH|nr:MULTISPECIES: ABC transporter permease subunit [Devosia]ODT48958.1 MAG: oligopeptide transporter permease [Pelagibacterium sp. SCN 63-126]ODU89351.1 MAG: oligopeptide transporter permease [Pelagibacterium sp. SCN 63-17]OJX44112.1 MAG: oligopeptide transporter permease [Devosia sp. 63-57]VDS04416.1 Oligopeptide transport system permease protein OppB [Devosia equisanguinis]
MLAYAFRRVLSAIPIALIAVTVCFFILRLAPGGPFDGERALPPTVLANLRAHYNLDQPLITQYFIYVWRLLQGDLGPSMVIDGFNVSQLIAIGFPFTLTMALTAFVIATAIGMLAGMVAAVYQNKWPDYVLVLGVMIGVLIPNFLMAALLQLWFGVYLKWLPAGGWVNGSWMHLVLPVTVLAWPHAGRISRLMRGSMIEVLGTNYVRTARSKGLGERLVLARHAIKPALLPVVSYLGPGLSYLLTGSLAVEQIFGLPGIGKYFVTAALNRDYGIVLGTTILYMFIILALNLIVDLIYAWLDPKVRYR